MSDRDVLELRVQLTRLAAQLSAPTSQRDIEAIAVELAVVRQRLDSVLTALPLAA
jgi:hypothetical protein